jgi:glycosyltransferase involved in cell wall biosynthesis
VNSVPRDPRAPWVSVVIPTYNYAGVLAYAIASVLDQAFSDFELIVVGDGCSDDSEHVATSTGDARVRWVNLPTNTGHQSEPNNEGLRRARGDVVAFLGHDDVWLPHHLEVLREAFDAGAVAAHTTTLRVDPGVPCYREPYTAWSYKRGSYVAPASLAIRRETAIEVGGWRRTAETGVLVPEADLVARVYDVSGPPRWIPRLTCVKLAAGLRRNCYRTKPTHEQAYWLDQIRAADDPERVVGQHEGRISDLASPEPMGLLERAWRAAPMGLPERAWRSARYRLRKRRARLAVRLRLQTSAQTQIRRQQRFKGVR